MKEAPVERSTMWERLWDRILWSDPSGARLRWRYRFIWAPLFSGLGLFTIGGVLIQHRWLSPVDVVLNIAGGVAAVAIGYAFFREGRRPMNRP